MTTLTDRTLDFERCYRALSGRDDRFDGWFVVGVRTTGIYCRPSCPAVVAKREHVTFLRTPAAAQRSGFRACKRCRPDASPGSPEWNVRTDVVGRAMRLIADGVVDRDGVAGLAARLGYSRRQLQRQLVGELGVGPLALARAQRAQTARHLVESTDLPLHQVAFAAGFGSTRQFNATVREVYACTPGELRRRARGHGSPAPGGVTVDLPARAPFDGAGLLAFLGARAVPGVEAYRDATYVRALTLPHGDGVVALRPSPAGLRCQVQLADLRDLGPAIQRCRRLGDLDADPVAVGEALGADAVVGPLVAATPGRRVPGAADPAELAVRAVLGQGVLVAAATRSTAALVAAAGAPLTIDHPLVGRRFPTGAAVAEAARDLPIPARRRATLRALGRSLASGTVPLDPGCDPPAAVAALRGIAGIGPWTTGYVAMRGLSDPDADLPGDAAIRRALRRRGHATAAARDAVTSAWRPWRAYAIAHLWADEASRARTRRGA